MLKSYSLYGILMCSAWTTIQGGFLYMFLTIHRCLNYDLRKWNLLDIKVCKIFAPHTDCLLISFSSSIGTPI